MSKELETLRELKNIGIDEESDGETIFLSDKYSKEFSIIEKALKEHEQHKAIEKELGIDLVKLIECVRNEKGIWKKDFNGGLINTRCMLTCYFGKWQIYDKENIYELKDYGKTWALTREELEK